MPSTNTQADTRRENLQALVDTFGQAAVARYVGKPDRQIADILAGRRSMGEKLARIMEANWLQSRNEPLHLDIARQSAVKEARPEARISLLDDEVPIPQFDTGGKMGDGLELRDQPGMIKSWRVDLEWLNKNVRGATSASNLCIVTGFGDSMRPMFNPGDPLLVDRGVITADYDAVYFFRVDGEGFIKRLQKIPGKGLVALSENPAYQAWVVEPSMDFEVFGRVLKVWRSEDF
ncbi:S24 family peptidase [Achromobacter xylosoxidans]|uniref:S24 family peptidase n=1 Tax=Alcaligenes xylosoxydans xylosoxydans TaxID=85698 RepID=UPI001F13CC5A|nr:S24 family peptidase [Achromobacter xylosoxidans]